MTFTPDNAVIWTEIPVTDLDAAMAFYGAIIGAPLTRDDGGPNPIAIFSAPKGGVAGHLYPGAPASDGQGPTVHLAVDGSLEDAIARCKKAGGAVISAPVALPMGRFAYARDLDGNSIGLFESA